MAKWHAPLVLGALLTQLALVGCQQQTPPVATLPPPSFDAPRLAMARPPAPVATPRPLPNIAVLPPAPKAITPPKSPALAGIPREWIPPVAPRDWRAIVVHHSATTTGGAAAFDKMHRAKGWDELGYDFVIGNGTDTADGQIEVGPRWAKQKYGAHDKTPDNWYNEHGIGICLVGNFDVERPTPKQMQSLTKLVTYLMHTYHITPDHLVGHGETKSTECPGKYMNIAQLRRQEARIVSATDGVQATQAAIAPDKDEELLTATTR
ncbi:MAG TPA: N-acetylmuramoyl-L-alanine amidase [Tepidisphaeraceae bacterium]|nr:N-acetylmuramoyl-L-alanine amidase [Tepidisphaeraceae bacterium]